jgi:hypothetical protein
VEVLVSPPPLVLLLRALEEEGSAVVLPRLEDHPGLVRQHRRRALIHPATVTPVVVAAALGPVRQHRELTFEVRQGRSLRPIIRIPLERHLLLQHQPSPLGRPPTSLQVVGSEMGRILICFPVRRYRMALIRPCISIPTVTTWETITIRIVAAAVSNNKHRPPTFRLGHQRLRVLVLGVLRPRRLVVHRALRRLGVDRARRRRLVDRAR